MNQSGIIIRESGKMERIDPQNGTDFNLDELYKALDCSVVEVVNLDEDIILIIDEEGKFNSEKGVNLSATIIAQTYKAIFKDDCIVGDAVLCPSEMFQ